MEGRHAQVTPAYQRRPTTLHELQGSNPPIRALYMQLAKIPNTHQTTPRANSAPDAKKPTRHRPWAQHQLDAAVRAPGRSLEVTASTSVSAVESSPGPRAAADAGRLLSSGMSSARTVCMVDVFVQTSRSTSTRPMDPDPA